MQIVPSNNSGFSLLELLAVIAIVGILAIIGVPQYAKFKIKARSAEAKTQLHAIYQAEHVFFLEYERYHPVLDAIGYAPLANARFNSGFSRLGTGFASILNSNFGAHATLDTTRLNTKAICQGTYGTDITTSCELIVDAPELPFISTVYSTGFIATSLTDVESDLSYDIPSNYFSPVATLMWLAVNPQIAMAVNEDRYPGFAMTSKGILHQGTLDDFLLSCDSNPDHPYCSEVSAEIK